MYQNKDYLKNDMDRYDQFLKENISEEERMFIRDLVNLLTIIHMGGVKCSECNKKIEEDGTDQKK